MALFNFSNSSIYDERYSSINRWFLIKLCKSFSFEKKVKFERTKTFIDWCRLGVRVWPYYYFNWNFSRKFEDKLETLIFSDMDIDSFKKELIILFQLHYIASLCSYYADDMFNDELLRVHYIDMKEGFDCLIESTGQSKMQFIENAQDKMLYYDLTYSWSNSPNKYCGFINSYYSSKSFLYHILKLLENAGSEQ